MGVVASRQVVVVALGHTLGTAPEMVYPVTDRLVGLDPRTGALLWSLPLVDDGQGVPAMTSGGDVLVAEANGTVLGVDGATGVRRWSDPRPPECAAGSSHGGLDPVAALVPGGPAATVVYGCSHRQRLARLDPRTGAVLWTWQLPARWAVDYQAPAATASGVIGVVMSGWHLKPIAPLRLSPPSARGYMSESMVALDATSGKPMWQVDNVLTAGVYGGSGRLCIVSGYGVAAYKAHSGVRVWQWRPPVVPADGGGLRSGVVAEGGQLFTTVPTRVARSIPAESTTYHSPPGAFRLRVTSMATGRVVAAEDLPAYYGGPEGVVVSADSPPGVPTVTRHEILVDPQSGETDVIEAFARLQ